MYNRLNIPEKVPKHLTDLERICQEHAYAYNREIDEKSFSDIAFKMLLKMDAKEVAEFITKIKGELELAYRKYNEMREQVNRFLWSATRDTLPWPYSFMVAGAGDTDKLVALLKELESAEGACKLADQYKDARPLVGKAIIDAKKLVIELTSTILEHKLPE